MSTLHDLSSVRPRKLVIEADPGSAFELLSVLVTALGSDQKSNTHAVGGEWFDEFRTALSSKTRSLAKQVSPHGELWVNLIPVIETAPGDHGIDSVLSWLEASDPVAIRRMVLEGKFWDLEDEVLADAAVGNKQAVAAVVKAAEAREDDSYCQSLETFLDLPADRALKIAVEVMRRARDEAFHQVEEDWSAAQKRDAEAKRLLIDTYESPAQLIDAVTNGIAYELPVGIRRLVLVPSVSLRPWTMITDLGDTVVVCHPVAEENLVHDPDAPPNALVAVYRALGDERRLRLLRRLAEGPASLADLTDHLGLAKSTVFHHIGVLRTAGLVRVAISADHKQQSTYSLRLEAFPDQRTLMDQYLTKNSLETETPK